MNTSDPNDDQFDVQLAELHEAIVRDDQSASAGHRDGAERFKACLALIERVRRGDSAEADTAKADGDTGGRKLETTDEDVPQSIGRFKIVRQVGEGGYGLVFEAIDPALNRQVALKVPRAQALMSAELRTRFLREAEAAAALDHPNIVSVYESGSVGPVCYIASAFVSGVSLDKWLSGREQPVEPKAAARLVQVLADAVAHAHSRGVLHRDIKPGNVLLESQASSVEGQEQGDSCSGSRLLTLDSRPLITDFGLARFLDDKQHNTRSQAILGTPSYMSPEQADGRVREIGTAADIYSLGVVLYELLTGAPPFRADTYMGTLQAVRDREPTPPNRVRNTVPVDLAAVCLKCLEKTPEHRYTSAAALAEDLHRFLSGHPVQARPRTSVQRLGRWAARNSLVAGVTVLALLLLVALSIVSTVGYVSTARALRDRDEALVSADEHRAEALRRFELAQNAVSEFLVEITNDPRLQSKPLEPLRRSMLERARDHYDKLLREMPDDPALRKHTGLASWRLGNIYRLVGDFENSAAAFDTSIQILQQLVANDPENLELQDHLGRAFHDYGVMFHRQDNNWEAAAIPTESAFEIYQRIEGLARQEPEGKLRETILQNAALTYNNAAGTRVARKEFDEALGIHNRALAVRHELVEEYPQTADNHSLLANSHASLGILYAQMGQASEAELNYEKAVEILETLIPQYPDKPQYVFQLANTRFSQQLHYDSEGRHEESADVLRAAIDDLEDLCRRHPDVPAYMLQLAKLHHNLGVNQWTRKVAGTAESYARARELMEALRERDYPISWSLVYATYLNQAAQHHQAGDLAAAAGGFEAALEVCRQRLLESPNDSLAQLSLADVMLSLGRNEEQQQNSDGALTCYDDAVEIVVAVLEKTGGWHQAKEQLGEAYVTRARLLDKLSRAEDAFQDRMRAAELGFSFRHEEMLFELTRKIAQNPEDPEVYLSRARRYYSLGEMQNTIADCTRSIELNPDVYHFYGWRGRASLQLLDLAQAREDFERVLELRPEEYGASLNLAWTYAVGPPSLRNPERALELARQVVALKPDRNKDILGLAHLRCGNHGDALKALSRRSRSGWQPNHFFVSSMSHARLGNSAEALDHFEEGNKRLKPQSNPFWDHCTKSLLDECAKLLGIDPFTEAEEAVPSAG